MYSTCSVHAVENERVVEAVLGTEEASAFQLAKKGDILPNWPRRGLQEEFGTHGDFLNFLYTFELHIHQPMLDANCLLRCKPRADLTNGFFVACFKKSSAGVKVQSIISDDHYDDVFEGMSEHRKRKRRRK